MYNHVHHQCNQLSLLKCENFQLEFDIRDIILNPVHVTGRAKASLKRINTV